MNRMLLVLLPLVLLGCGVEVLTTTAIQGELQAEQMKAMKRQIGHTADTSAKINIQRAIDIYAAEKGVFPATLEELAPGYIPSIPSHPDGTPYGYDRGRGMVLDGAVTPPPGAMVGAGPMTGPTAADGESLALLRSAIDTCGRSTGYYPASLAALAPSYLVTVPKTESGQDFLYDPATGAVAHPAQSAAGMGRGQGGPGRGQGQGRRGGRGGPGVGGAGPMGEAMTGIGIQQQLNSMGQSGANSAGGYARRGVQGKTQKHNQQQEKALKDLGL